MIQRILKSIGCLLLAMASVAQAASTYEAIDLIRPDGMKITLLSRTDGPDGFSYFLYSEPGVLGPGTCSENLTNKPQNMWNLAVILAKSQAININDNNRSTVMWGFDGTAWLVQLPTLDELLKFREANYNDWPHTWNLYCINYNHGVPWMQGGWELWSSSPGWSNHYTVDLGSGGGRQIRNDGEIRAVALRAKQISENEVCLFEGQNYDGRFRCFSAGDYTAKQLGDLDNKFSSIIAGKNCGARLYEHGDFQGLTAIFNEHRKTPEAWYWVGDIEDRTSSLKVRCGDDSTVGDSEVCLFEHRDERGNVACYGNGDVRHIEKYPNGQNADDTFSSMVVGKNCTIRIYEHADFRGNGLIFSGKDIGKRKRVDWLDDGIFKMNDKTSSISVTCS